MIACAQKRGSCGLETVEVALKRTCCPVDETLASNFRVITPIIINNISSFHDEVGRESDLLGASAVSEKPFADSCKSACFDSISSAESVCVTAKTQEQVAPSSAETERLH